MHEVYLSLQGQDTWQIRMHGVAPVNFSFSCSVRWFPVFHRKQDVALILEQWLLLLKFLHITDNPRLEATSVESLLCSHPSSHSSQCPWQFGMETKSVHSAAIEWYCMCSALIFFCRVTDEMVTLGKA